MNNNYFVQLYIRFNVFVHFNIMEITLKLIISLQMLYIK